MLVTENWCIKVDERIYGPYTRDQLNTFVSEGRFSEKSMVAPAGGKVWREARKYSPLASILDKNASKQVKFGKGDSENENNHLAEGQMANFAVIFDVVMGTAGRVEPLLRSLGDCFRVADNVWIVSSSQSVLGIKNTLAPHISVREPVFVIDCSRGRTSWQNFVPEIHSRMTRAWVKAQSPA